jgi:hypothetical protein
MIVGVAVLFERFYKPELDAAHNRRLQANRPTVLMVLKYPLSGMNDNWDFHT